jgi:hypothetical protein
MVLAKHLISLARRKNYKNSWHSITQTAKQNKTSMLVLKQHQQFTRKAFNILINRTTQQQQLRYQHSGVDGNGNAIASRASDFVSKTIGLLEFDKPYQKQNLVILGCGWAG